MREYYGLLMQNPLFRDIGHSEMSGLLRCMDASVRVLKAGETVFEPYAPVRRIGVVLEGELRSVVDDYFGIRHYAGRFVAGESFGEILAGAGETGIPAGIIAQEDGRVLLLNYRGLCDVCPNCGVFQARITDNITRILAKRALETQRRAGILSGRTTRERLALYLTALATVAKSKRVTVPLSRQELADYLSVDRGALSREMSAMKDEGLIDYSKNKFTVFGSSHRQD